jgi:hypothetical protein
MFYVDCVYSFVWQMGNVNEAFKCVREGLSFAAYDKKGLLLIHAANMLLRVQQIGGHLVWFPLSPASDLALQMP